MSLFSLEKDSRNTTVDIASKLSFLENKQLAVHKSIGSTLTSSYEDISSEGIPNTEIAGFINKNGLNYETKVLTNILGIVYDDSHTSGKNFEQESFLQKITDEAVKELRTGFFPVTAKAIYQNDGNNDIKRKISQTFTPIDIDNILPVSPQGYSFIHTGNVKASGKTKNYTTAYFTMFDLTIDKSPLMMLLMDKSMYITGKSSENASSVNSMNQEEWVRQMKLFSEQFLQQQQVDVSSLNRSYARELCKNVKSETHVKLFHKYMQNRPASETDSMDMSTYFNNITNFVKHHTIFSAQQRALLFEKDTGIRPFYYLGCFNNKKKWLKLVDHMYTKTADSQSILSSVMKFVKNEKETPTTNNFDTNRLWSSYVSDIWVSPKNGVKLNVSSNLNDHIDESGCFLHFFQHRIDKVYGYCSNLSQIEYSLIFDSAKDNAAVLEHYVSKFYQFCVTSRIANNGRVIDTQVKFLIILKPSTYLSDSSLYLCSSKYVDIVKAYINELADKNEIIEKSLMSTFFKDDALKGKLSDYETFVTISTLFKNQATVKHIPISDYINANRNDAPTTNVLKTIAKDFSPKNLIDNVDFLQFASRYSSNWFNDQKQTNDFRSLALYLWLTLLSATTTNKIHQLIDESLQKMAIPGAKISTEIITLPMNINVIKTPLGCKMDRFLDRIKVGTQLSPEEITMDSGYTSCFKITQEINGENNSSEKLRTLLTDSNLNSERQIPNISTNVKLSLKKILTYYSVNNQLPTKTGKIGSNFDPRSIVDELITFGIIPNLFGPYHKTIATFINFSIEQSVKNLLSLEGIQEIVDDSLDHVLELENFTSKSIPTDIENTLNIKTLPDSVISRLVQVAEILLRPPSEDDVEEIEDILNYGYYAKAFGGLTDEELNSYFTSETTFMERSIEILRQAKLTENEKINIDGTLVTVDKEIAKKFEDIFVIDSIIRLNEIRSILGRRICKLVQIWKMSLKNINTITSVWHTFTDPKKKPDGGAFENFLKERKLESILSKKINIPGCVPETEIGLYKYKMSTYYENSKLLSLRDRRYYLLSDVLESFEDPMANNEAFISSTTDKISASNQIIQQEKLKALESETNAFLEEQKEESNRLNQSAIKNVFSWFGSKLGNITNIWTTPPKAPVVQQTISEPSTTREFDEENTNFEYDDIDWLIDTTTVCGFFKNVVLLDHGYMSNENILYGLCKNEGSAFNYMMSIVDEFRSGVASSSVVSPFKGYLDKFYDEFRNPKNVANNALFNIRIMTNRWRLEVSLQENAALNLPNTGFIPVSKSNSIILYDNTKIVVDNTPTLSISMSQYLDAYGSGPAISHPNNIISAREMSLHTAVKWLKLLGITSDSTNMVAHLLDINTEYVNPYTAPINRQIGTGLSYFMEDIFDEGDYSHVSFMTQFMEMECACINDGVVLLPSKESFYMNPFFSFVNDGLNDNVHPETTLLGSVKLNSVNLPKGLFSERNPLETFGNILMSKSTLFPNITWLDSKTMQDISKTIFTSNKQSFIDWVSENILRGNTKPMHLKLWDSVNYKMYSDLVPTDILCSVKANRIHCRTSMSDSPANIPFVENKMNAFKTSVSDPFKELSSVSLEDFVNPGFLQLTTYYDEQSLQKFTDTEVTKSVSSLDTFDSFLEERSREFNLRKTYFDIACTNICPIVRYGSIKKPLLNKGIWKTVVNRKPTFGSHVLSKSLDKHIKSLMYEFHKESVSSPQLYNLHGRKMNTISSSRTLSLYDDDTNGFMDDYYNSTLTSFVSKPLNDILFGNTTEKINTILSDEENQNDVSIKIQKNASDFVTSESVDLRWLIDASFVRNTRNYINRMHETEAHVDNYENESNVNPIYKQKYKQIVSAIQTTYMDDFASHRKIFTNVPTSAWSRSDIPVVNHVISNGVFYNALVGTQNQRKVNIPIYSLDSGDECALLVPPYYSQEIMSDLEKRLASTPEPNASKLKMLDIYRDLSWISDNDKQENTGNSIVATMCLVASMWVVCMTAKIEALEIYKPQDILKMTVGKWVVPHTIDASSNSVSGVSMVNKHTYDLYEKEFTGISDIVIAELTNGYGSSNNDDESSSVNIKTTSPTLSTEGRLRLKQAFEYTAMLPDMYRKHVGHILHAYEKQAINNSGDPIKARQQQLLNMDVIHNSHAYMENPQTNTISQNMFMLEQISKENEHEKIGAPKEMRVNKIDTSLLTLGQRNSIIVGPGPNIYRYAELAQTVRLVNSETELSDLLIKQQHALVDIDSVEQDNTDSTYRDEFEQNGQNVSKYRTTEDRYSEDVFEQNLLDKIEYEPNSVPSIKHQEQDKKFYKSFLKLHKKYATLKKLKDTDVLLNADGVEGYSVASILYSTLTKNDKTISQTVISPLKRDSFNVVYTLTKMMESGGTQPTRLLDVGAGLSTQLLTSEEGRNTIQELLEASISMNGLDLWSTFGSTAYEIGALDSLISDE